MKKILLLVVWILFVSNFVFAWSVWHILKGGNRIEKKTADIIINLAKTPSEFYHEFLILTGISPIPLVFLNKEDSYKTKHLSGYLLVSSINKDNKLAEIQLVDLSKQKTVQTWQPDISKLGSEKISKSNLRYIHPILYKKDLITLAEGNLYRFNANSSIVWQLNGAFHHSLELDSDKYIWVCGTIKSIELEQNIKSNPIKEHIFNDAIFKIDPLVGKVIYKKSIYDILISNGYKGLLFGKGPINEDIIHINDIQPAPKTTEYWQKGDLLISLRHLSTILLYRPSINKVVWLKSGPWNFQHDCDFVGDHKIGIFGNDVVDFNGKTYLLNGNNNEYIYDFSTDQVSTPYTKMFQKGKIKTLTEGRSRILPDGQLFVEETNYGRILFGDRNGVNGIYVNRLDKEHIGALGWSRYYTNEEFNQTKN